MRTVYSNTRHPKFVKWSCGVMLALGIASCVMFMVAETKDWDCAIIFQTLMMLLVYPGIFFGEYYLYNYSVDEEEDTLTYSAQKKFPMYISQIEYVKYKESKKGKFRSLFVHDTGVHYMDIRTSKENADSIVARLLAANPHIEVRHGH